MHSQSCQLPGEGVMHVCAHAYTLCGSRGGGVHANYVIACTLVVFAEEGEGEYTVIM